MSNFRSYIIVLLTFISIALSGQSIEGVVLDSETGEPIANAELKLVNDGNSTLTLADGSFQLQINQEGRYSFSIVKEGYEKYFSNFSLKKETLNLGSIKLYQLEDLNEKDVSYLSETDVNQSDETSEVLSLLTASQDEFSRTAAFDFGVARFKVRGYHPNFNEIYMNGMPMNDLDDGYAAWSIWGGLNEVVRRRQSNHSLEPSFFAFGGLGGSNHVSTLASDQRKQIRASFSFTNRSYRQRAMLTYSTGMMKNGWAVSVSGSRRWSEEGYIEATFYDAYAGFISIDRKLNRNNLLNLTVLNSPNVRGRSSGAVQEIYDITGNNYHNSYWGLQDGKKRNSRKASSNQPLAVLRHLWTPGDQTTINTTIGYQGGSYATTRLDWYNAADPRPDYYRYLPSYKTNETEAAELYTLLQNNPEMMQVNWDKMYEVNQLSNETIYNVNGEAGNNLTGKMSQYILQEQHQDPLKLSFNSYIQTELNDFTSFNGGISYQNEKVKQFSVVDDLLGGEFYVNFDKYAERDFPNNPDVIQNDLNNPNNVVYEGDVFGYNYEINSSKAKAWAKTLFVLDKLDLYIAGDVSYTSFFRNGLYKNGKFPESSYGKSETVSFLDFGVKAGLTYKINGRNYLYANGLYMTRPPFARNVYISPRTRDHIVKNLTSEEILGGEIGYELKSPLLALKATAYYTEINNQTKVRSFFHDDEVSFVNYILTGIDEVHMGTELSAKYKISSTLDIKAVASIGDYFYNSRPVATISQDNNAEVLTDKLIYMKNFKINGTPQRAYSLALSYNSPKFWFVNLSFNYFDKIYLDFNPERRTVEAVDGIDKEANPVLWSSIIQQEQLPSDYIVNFFGGKSWKIKDYYLYLQLGVNNVLNNKKFITGGYEQFRFDYDNRDVNTYPSRYYYAYGMNYFLNLSFRI